MNFKEKTFFRLLFSFVFFLLFLFNWRNLKQKKKVKLKKFQKIGRKNKKQNRYWKRKVKVIIIKNKRKSCCLQSLRCFHSKKSALRNFCYQISIRFYDKLCASKEETKKCPISFFFVKIKIILCTELQTNKQHFID